MPLYSQNGYGSGGYGQADGGPIYNLPLSYYVDLLTSQYKLAPKLNAWVAALLGPMVDATDCLSSFNESFDLDTAVGAQLDILGELITGNPNARTVPFQPSGGVSPVLTDDTFRLLLRATEAINHWDGLVSSLQPIWQSLFSGGRITIIDNQNMSATVLLSGGFSSIVQDMITHGMIVPHPEAVEYTYTFSTLPMFGFSTEDTAFIAGWNTGKWS